MVKKTCLPDLIITRVKHQLYLPSHTSNTPSSGELLASSDLLITIKNIGTAPMAELFYISWATKGTLDPNSLRNFNGHYGHSFPLNSKKNILNTGDSIAFLVPIPQLLAPYDTVKLLIETDGKPHLKRPLPKIDELNYENNTYEFVVPESTE